MESVSWVANHKSNLRVREGSPSWYKPERLRNKYLFCRGILWPNSRARNCRTSKKWGRTSEQWSYGDVHVCYFHDVIWGELAAFTITLGFCQRRAAAAPSTGWGGRRQHRWEGALQRPRWGDASSLAQPWPLRPSLARLLFIFWSAVSIPTCILLHHYSTPSPRFPAPNALCHVIPILTTSKSH